MHPYKLMLIWLTFCKRIFLTKGRFLQVFSSYERDLQYQRFGATHFKMVPCLKVENILKVSLDSISSPSPSVKIQIMAGKDVKAKHCWMLTFLPIIWMFTEGEGDEIESRLPFKIFSTISSKYLLVAMLNQ